MSLTPVMKLSCCDVPTVYSNKQSYYECLCYLGYKINECINAIKEYQDDYQSYTDDKVAELKEYVDNLNTAMKKYVDGRWNDLNETVNSYYTELTGEINALDEKIDTDITRLENYLEDKISELNVLIDTFNAELKAYINLRIDEVYAYIRDYYVNSIKIYDPATGAYTTIQQCVENIYNAVRYFAITASEFDGTGITAKGFDDENLLAAQFDLYGVFIFGKPAFLYMSNPLTGEYQFYQDVINDLADLHRDNPITASAFDALNLTATVFDGKQITAENFDNNAGNLLS